MTRDTQKREELDLVELMRRLHGGQPEGTLEAVGEPDVCVVSPMRRIGVEVTQLYKRPKLREPPRQQLESERSKMVAQAAALAQSAGIPPLDVAVHFDDQCPVRKQDRDLSAGALLALVSHNIPHDAQAVTIEMWRYPNEALPGVRLVRVFRADFLTKHHWSVPDAGWVQTDFVEELQHAIDEKNRRHATYRNRCDRCWLLVTATGGKASGLFEPSDDTKAHLYRSSFEKTFFMEVFGQVLIELNTISA